MTDLFRIQSRSGVSGLRSKSPMLWFWVPVVCSEVKLSSGCICGGFLCNEGMKTDRGLPPAVTAFGWLLEWLWLTDGPITQWAQRVKFAWSASMNMIYTLSRRDDDYSKWGVLGRSHIFSGQPVIFSCLLNFSGSCFGSECRWYAVKWNCLQYAFVACSRHPGVSKKHRRMNCYEIESHGSSIQ